ncbi:iron-siderophore ABC transporter substrate-binding protein [soil metagenome]
MAIAVASLLGACSSDDSSSTTTVEEASGATTVVEQPADDGPRTVEHAMGATVVPADPTKFVVLDSSMLDSAIALGVTPVGATEGVSCAGLPPYLGEDEISKIELVGLTETPNLEQIAMLQPDLIIGAKVRHENIYNELSQIAPTVFSESSGTNWTNQVKLTGDALGKADEAEALLEDFDTRATEVGQAIGAPGTTAVIVRFIPGQIRLYGPNTFSGSVLSAVGFTLAEREYDPAYSMAVISPERIDLVDADADVVFATNPSAESDGKITSDRDTLGALWTSLPAVAEGRQYDILDTTWMTGIGPIGANRILDDLEDKLG